MLRLLLWWLLFPLLGLISSNTSAGSIRGATVERLDSSCNVVSRHSSDAYGNDLSREADPYSGFGSQFGYYHDAETGLTYLQNRYYDQAFGRFLNRDPIGLCGGMNRYGFVSGNPITGLDPSGLDDESPLASFGRTVAEFGSYENNLITSYWSGHGGSAGVAAATAATTASDFLSGALSGLLRMGSDSGEYFGGNPSHRDGWAATQDILSIALAGLGGIEEFGLEDLAKGGCEQYSLVAGEDGFYPVMKRGFEEPQGETFLSKGDVWKEGKTIDPAGRYSQPYLDSLGVRYRTNSLGTESQALARERERILQYIKENGKLPPGNKIIR